MKSYIIPSALYLLSLISCQTDKKEKPPNILFIMSDDHTTQSISCYDETFIQTPNIDRLAKEGMRFDNCYVTNSLSGP